jgi:hypothetical protein
VFEASFGVIVCDLVTVPKVAETTAQPVMVGDKVNWNMPLSVPAGTVTVDGRLKPELVERSITVDGLEEAVVKTMTQVPACPGATDSGEQARVESEDGDGERTIGKETAVVPTWARTVEFCAALMAPALTVKAAELEPAGTVTEAGAVRIVGTLLVIETCVPPVGAGLLS